MKEFGETDWAYVVVGYVILKIMDSELRFLMNFSSKKPARFIKLIVMLWQAVIYLFPFFNVDATISQWHNDLTMYLTYLILNKHSF